MGRAIIEKLLPVLTKMEWPENGQVTELGRRTYEIGLDKADEFKYDSKVLAAALRTFQSGDSRPFAFAGVAYTLIKAAREADGTYDETGLKASLDWLERAQDTAPDVTNINMIEAYIYIYSGRYDDARLVLDYLEGLDGNNYHLHKAEIAYWQEQGLLDEAVLWYEKALDAADTVPQKLRLRGDLGDFYLAMTRYEKAVEIYREAIHFAKESPWLWHNMSLAYWHLEDFEEAARCNKKALALKPEFPGALKMEAMLDERMESKGFRKRLFGG